MLPLLLLERRGWSSSNVTYVPTGLSVPGSFPSERFFAACSLWTRRVPIRVCRFLPLSRLLTPGGIWSRTDRQRVQGHHSQRLARLRASECLLKLRAAKCGVEPVGGSGCKSGAFRLNVTRSRRIAKLHSVSHYITLTLPNIEYLAQMFNVVPQQLRDYIVDTPDVLSYVTTALTS